MVLERKTRGRQLHLAKRFGPKRTFFSCKKGTKQIYLYIDVGMNLYSITVVMYAVDGDLIGRNVLQPAAIGSALMYMLIKIYSPAVTT